MFKTKSVMEVEVKGRKFALECSTESTYSDVVEALVLMHGSVIEVIKKLEEKAKETKDAESC